MKMTLGLIIRILITLIAIVVVWLVWTKNIDWKTIIKRKLPDIPLVSSPPMINYGISTIPTEYENGILIHNVKWRENYSYHILSVVNSTNSDLKNFIISIHFPGAIVYYKTESLVNVHNINYSQYNQPITLGKEKQKITRIENTISNSIDISVEKMNQHSTLTISFVLDYRDKPKGFWQFDLSYEFNGNEGNRRIRFINPIVIANNIPLSISIDKNTNYIDKDSVKATTDIYPQNPLISLPDGRFIQIDNFNGNLDSIKQKGDLIMSMGFDYEVNTKNDFK